MEFADEAIIKARRQMEEREKERHSEDTIQKELEQSIDQDVVEIYQIPVPFEERDILEGRAVIRLPKDFTPRSEEEIDSAFLLGNKPQWVYSNEYLAFMIALNWTSNLLADSQVGDFMKYAKYVMERVGPKSRVLKEDRIMREEGGNLAWFHVLANTIESVNYMVIFMASVEGRLLLGTVTFEQKYSKRLAPLAEDIVKSFRLKEKGEKEI